MKIMHVNTACVILGTTCHTLSMIQAYPEHEHVVVFLSGPTSVSEFMISELIAAEAILAFDKHGCDYEKFTLFDPDLIILNNGRDGWIDFNMAGELAEQRVLVSYSHDLDIVIPSTFNIWNSEFTMNINGGDGRGIPTFVMGSFINADLFDVPDREYGDRHSIGMLSTGPRRFGCKLGEQLITLFMRMGFRHKEATFTLPNARKLLSLPPWCHCPDYTGRSVDEFYQGLDIFVYYTDKQNADGWGRPVTEAMAAGLPVVAEKRGAIVEQIDHGVNGFLATTDDEFIEYVDMLCDDAALREQLGTAARTKAREQFGIPAIRSTMGPVFELAQTRHDRRVAT